MYFTGNQKVVESEAIASMNRFDLVTINGEQYVDVLFKLDPTVRHYEEGEAPAYFALADGINVRLLQSVGLPDVAAEAAAVVAEAVPAAPIVAPEAPAPAPVAAPEVAPAAPAAEPEAKAESDEQPASDAE